MEYVFSITCNMIEIISLYFVGIEFAVEFDWRFFLHKSQNVCSFGLPADLRLT